MPVWETFPPKKNPQGYDRGAAGTVLTGNGPSSAPTFQSLPAASTTAQGVVELADSSEAAAGTDADRAITPATLRNGLNATGSAPVYACRAWANFNGTGTPALRGSGNVTSITDHGPGDFTLNLTTALPDTNYATVVTGSGITGAGTGHGWFASEHIGSGPALSRTTTSVRLYFFNTSFAFTDPFSASVAIFR